MENFYKGPFKSFFGKRGRLALLSKYENDPVCINSNDMGRILRLMSDLTVDVQIIAFDYNEDMEGDSIKLRAFIERKNGDKMQVNLNLCPHDSAIIMQDEEGLKKYARQIWKKDEGRLMRYARLDAERELKKYILYMVLATCSNEAFCPTGYDEFINWQGLEDTPKSKQTHLECLKFAKESSQFFTNEEIECLPTAWEE
jgi:hypothetical protein